MLRLSEGLFMVGHRRQFVVALAALLFFGLALGAGAEVFDPETATRAYLDQLSPEERARSDAYFEGGYWLRLWGLLYGLGVAVLLLGTRLSARMRDLGMRVGRWRWAGTALYAAQYAVATFLLGLPLAIYRDFFREHSYGLSNLYFGEWMAEQGKSLGVEMVLLSVLIVGIYAVLRRARHWWLWGTLVSLVFLAFLLMIFPVYVAPVFNDYRPVEDPEVRDSVLRMARSHGVAADEVWVFDASRQTKRISANVSGFLGTERISLNDNLLERTSLPEIEAVMGHELGHYVLGHTVEGFVSFGLVIFGGFAFLAVSFEHVRTRWGRRWGVEGIGDVAGLPLLGALFAVYFFVLTPVISTVIRSNEAEADAFGLAVARQPDGFAQVAIRLSEYRKLDPGPVERFVFFDHPSGRDRVERAMRWKAEHLAEIATSDADGDEP